jgi:hypothetical protein
VLEARGSEVGGRVLIIGALSGRLRSRDLQHAEKGRRREAPPRGRWSGGGLGAGAERTQRRRNSSPEAAKLLDRVARSGLQHVLERRRCSLSDLIRLLAARGVPRPVIAERLGVSRQLISVAVSRGPNRGRPRAGAGDVVRLRVRRSLYLALRAMVDDDVRRATDLVVQWLEGALKKSPTRRRAERGTREMPGEETVVMQLRVPDELVERLRARATALGIGVNDFIRGELRARVPQKRGRA